MISELAARIVGGRPAPPQAREHQIVCIGNRLTVAALFNDRTPIAWVIVVFYFFCAAACFLAWNAAESREKRFWLAATVLLALLGLNKELDLQAALTQDARTVVRLLGLYEQRRLMQGGFLLLLGTAGLIAVLFLARWLRGSSRAAARIAPSACGT